MRLSSHSDRLTVFVPPLPEARFQQLKQVFYYLFPLICSLRLNAIWPPRPKVQCTNFLDFQSAWGKLMERSCLRLNFFYKGCKIAALKSFFLFFSFFFKEILPYFFVICATIRIGREMLCLPYVGSFISKFTTGYGSGVFIVCIFVSVNKLQFSKSGYQSHSRKCNFKVSITFLIKKFTYESIFYQS